LLLICILCPVILSGVAMKQHDQFKRSLLEANESPSVAPRQVFNEPRNDDSELLRDTLAFHIGLVSNLLLQQSFSTAGTISRYFAWLDGLGEEHDEEEGPHHELARAGLGPDGSFQVVARPRIDEFFGHLSHPDFSAVVSLAYSVVEREVIGIHLVGFSGKPVLATRWLQGLRRALTRQHDGVNTPPTFIN
jgi:hypothetical protein